MKKISNPVLRDLAKQSGELGADLVRQTAELPGKAAADAVNQTGVLLGREVNLEQKTAQSNANDATQIAGIEKSLNVFKSKKTPGIDHTAEILNIGAPQSEKPKYMTEEKIKEKPSMPLVSLPATHQGPGKAKPSLAVSNTRLEQKVNRKAA